MPIPFLILVPRPLAVAIGARMGARRCGIVIAAQVHENFSSHVKGGLRAAAAIRNGRAITGAANPSDRLK
jgi:hypothetical protein